MQAAPLITSSSSYLCLGLPSVGSLTSLRGLEGRVLGSMLLGKEGVIVVDPDQYLRICCSSSVGSFCGGEIAGWAWGDA